MRETIEFHLGAQPRALRGADPKMTVLEYLRMKENLVGTKEGCAEGDCGACTVVLVDRDGRPQAVNSCVLFVPALDGKQLLTVEHLAEADGTLHPVQQAMVDHHGSQCGFCTPGFVMSLYALRAEVGPGPVPDRVAVNEALAGNLCRCTGYRPIVDAAMAVCGGQAVAEPALLPAVRARSSEVEPTSDVNRPLKEKESERENAKLTLSRSEEAPPPIEESLALTHGGRQSFSPRSADELAHILIEHPLAVIVAGGTDVGLWVTKQHRSLAVTISLEAVADLRRVNDTADTIQIGAGVTYQDALPVLEKHFPDLGGMIRRIGSRQIRNRGTIGGNIANASPIGDMPPALLALDAALVLRRADARRVVKLDDFFTGYRRTVLAAGEFIERIDVPVPRDGAVFRCYKVSKRLEQDISAVCAAFRVRLLDGVVSGIRIGFGGMAATPVRAVAVEEFLLGRAWTEATIRMAQSVMDDAFVPLSDMRATAGYRRTVARNLLLKCFLEINDEAAVTRLVPA